MNAVDYQAGINRHYASANLADAILEALRKAGKKDTERLTYDDLAPFDQFHSRGKPATLELAQRVGLAPGTVLDIGGGLGARLLAAEFGCRVTVLDVTESISASARP